jgi:mannosyltransferase
MKRQRAPGRQEIEIIIPNLNSRYSGVTAAATAVVPHQLKEFNFAQTGYGLPLDIPCLGLRELFRLTARPLPGGRPRIFHARRNIEMLAGLILKNVFQRKLHLVFTSVAQRHHSAWTRFLYRRMDTLISTSPRSAEFLLRPVDAIVPHGVDTEIFRPAASRTQAWAESGAPGRFGIGIFGRIRPQKGVEEFVDALCSVLPHYPDFAAVITGETTPQFAAFEARLKKKIREQGLEDRFLWLGKLPTEEVRKWLQRVSLAAAVSRNEGFGLTCLEAMASGAAVIGTQTGAFDMIIRDGVDGLVVPCGDTAALTAAFDKLLSSPDELARMGKAARLRVCDSFSIQLEAEGLNTVYRGILKATSENPKIKACDRAESGVYT